MTDFDKDKIVEKVLELSAKWIESFNEGDAEACIAVYRNCAVLSAKPFGTFTGTEEIESFWRPLMGGSLGDLEYYNVKVEVIDENTAHLSAEWKLNLGRGEVTKDVWVKQPDGGWLVDESNFELLEQYFPEE
jgi:ketosteroid isomerase-like protein